MEIYGKDVMMPTCEGQPGILPVITIRFAYVRSEFSA